MLYNTNISHAMYVMHVLYVTYMLHMCACVVCDNSVVYMDKPSYFSICGD